MSFEPRLDARKAQIWHWSDVMSGLLGVGTGGSELSHDGRCPVDADLFAGFHIFELETEVRHLGPMI